jgi:hypothetical protein
MHNESMSTRRLFFAGALLAGACTHCGPKVQEPVGQSITRTPISPSPAPPPPATAREGTTDPCTADPPVIEFNGASTDVATPQDEALKQLAGCLNGAALEKTSVVLIGYTDVIGTVPANLELGLSRAQVVMRHLVSGGVAPGRIVVASAGELQRPSARRGLHAPRVEILLANGGPSRPNEAPINRGIDAEGLVPPPRQPGTTTAAPTARPVPQPAQKR